MGYAVYEDRDARDWGVLRWAGYEVPGECDMPDCTEKIDRGLGYKCEDHGDFIEVLDEEVWQERPGCLLYFCETHRYFTDAHKDVEPKPDTQEWIDHMLTDESWGQWRRENTHRVKVMSNRG